MEESSLNFATDRQKTIGVRRRRLVRNESCIRRRGRGRVWCALEEWRSGVGIYTEMARVGHWPGRPKWVEKCVRSIDLPRLPVNPVVYRSVSNVCGNRRPGKPVGAIITNVSRNRRPGNPVSAFGRKSSPNHLQLQTSWQRPGVTKERGFKWVYRTSWKLVFSLKDLLFGAGCLWSAFFFSSCI
jgi:hypothetical protein